MMRFQPRMWTLLCVACWAPFTRVADIAAESVERPAGICAVIGDTTLEYTLPLAKESDTLFYVQIADAKAVESARRKAYEAGLHGTQIFVEKGDQTHIHLADNMVDRVIVLGNTNDAPESFGREMLRVLRPQGKALVDGVEIVKAVPEGVDDWSHPYHGPDNNPQSNDQIAKAPYLTQFLARPYYAPLPQLATASAGRLFKAFGHIAFKPREEPLLNSLVAYNGYNGTMLWKRQITPGLMVHRNTMIATPDRLYFGDDKSCKIINPVTGKLIDEIVPPVDVAGGTFWKWMALEDGVLYALVGKDEPRDPVVKLNRLKHGWPWNPLSPGYNQEKTPWGFGRTLMAIDPDTKSVIWHYQEETPIDSRSVSLANGKIFFMRFGEYVGCIDAKSGNSIWRKTPKNDPGLFETIGSDLNRQDWRTNWRTAGYMKSTDKAVYLAGTMFGKLLALSADTGSILWQDDYSNYQLVLRDDALYAISGQIDEHVSKKIDPISGENLGELAIHRRGCTRPTGSADAVFFRADGGSVRFDVDKGERQWVSPMRAQCHDGVTIANGLLYWWPSTCDCQLSLYGMTCLGPAGDFDFATKATKADRLEVSDESLDSAVEIADAADWPTYRANNTGRATSAATISENCEILWQSAPQAACTPTAPVAAYGHVYVGGSDGIVHALNATTGEELWSAFTGGAIRMPPTVWEDRVLVGSGDGWVYAFEATSGATLWRFRAAPIERKIPVYGSLLSTWPVASGVLVEDGIAYFAAGIVNYDGTYVYALDAKTGDIVWQNVTSGHLDPDARTGVSVQGQMLLHDGKLYLAGGTSVSPAVYDIKDGKCLNDPAQLKECYSIYPRGAELSLFGDHVFACGQPLYKDPDHMVHDPSAIDKVFLATVGGRDVFWANNSQLICSKRVNRERLNKALAAREYNYMIPAWGELKFRDEPVWKLDCPDSRAIALCTNAAVVAADSGVSAVEMKNGAAMWQQPLPAPPVTWGMAVDRAGRAIVSLRNGQIVCVGQ